MPSTSTRVPAQRLSQSTIAALQASERDYFVHDTEVRGLQLKVTPAGNKSFVVRYRNSDGRERKQKLGNFPNLNASQARRKAQEMLAKVALGDDPAEERSKRRKGITFSDYCDQFLSEHVELHLADSTVTEYRRLLHRYVLPRVGSMKMSSVSREDFEALKRDLKATPHQANRVMAVVRKLFNHAIENGHAEVSTNPLQHIKQFKEQPRERILTSDEQERIANAITTLRFEHPENTSSYDAIVFLFLTGRRRAEVLQLKWSDIDFERDVIYYRKTKTDPQKSQLTPAMREFLLSIKESSTTEHIFPGRVEGQPITDPKRSWKKITSLAGLSGVRLHDIRHTVVSEVTTHSDLQSAAIVAGHKSLQSTMRYVHGLSSTATSALQKASAGRAALMARAHPKAEKP